MMIVIKPMDTFYFLLKQRFVGLVSNMISYGIPGNFIKA